MDEMAFEDMDTMVDDERRVAAFMNEEILFADPSMSLRDAATALDDASVGLMVIGTAAAVEGVISERDVVGAVATNLDLDATSVAAIETTSLKWATPDTPVSAVLEEMMENYVRHVLIGDGGELVGVVSMRDLFSAFLD